jgi:hypothetical protein
MQILESDIRNNAHVEKLYLQSFVINPEREAAFFSPLDAKYTNQESRISQQYPHRSFSMDEFD